jgi:hypothetical protein
MNGLMETRKACHAKSKYFQDYCIRLSYRCFLHWGSIQYYQQINKAMGGYDSLPLVLFF